jgi:hypothetical protein
MALNIMNIKIFSLLLAGLFCTSCALNYIDETGNKRVIGLVNMTIELDPETQAGTKIYTSNLGLMYFSSPISGGLAIGYTKEELILLKNNVLVFPNENKQEKKEKNDVQ